MLQTLKEFLLTLHPQAYINLGILRMKVYEALSRSTYLDNKNCIALDLDTYNYTLKYDSEKGIYTIKVF